MVTLQPKVLKYTEHPKLGCLTSNKLEKHLTNTAFIDKQTKSTSQSLTTMSMNSTYSLETPSKVDQ